MAPLANAVLLEDRPRPRPDTADLDGNTDSADPNPVIRIQDIATYPFSSATPHDLVTDLTDRLGPGNYMGIAKRSGVSRWHVGRILSGRAKGWGPNVGDAIAQAAGVTYDELYQWWRAVRTHRQETVNGRLNY